jgi:putative NADPH-quinone reductase
MKSYWHAPNMQKAFFDRILKEGVVFAHGVKDESVMKLVRQKFLC